MHPHEEVVAEQPEKKQTINGTTEALAKLPQEADVITYEAQNQYTDWAPVQPSRGFAVVRALKIEEEEKPRRRIRTQTDQLC